MRVADIMTANVLTLNPSSSVRHAAELMLRQSVSGMPVVDDEGAVVGMLSEGDLLRRAELGACFIEAARQGWEHGDPSAFVHTHSWKVGDVMSAPVIAVTEKTPLSEIAQLFLEKGIKRVPVLRDGKLVGLVSRADLLKCLGEDHNEHVAAGDEALKRAVGARLRQHAVLPLQPTITVKDGIVHLWGSLPSEADRQAVRVIIEGIGGVGGLDDHMTVAASPPAFGRE